MKKEGNESKPGQEQYIVPPNGSLGLLALGYKGLLAWREAKKKYLQEKEGGADGKKNG